MCPQQFLSEAGYMMSDNVPDGDQLQTDMKERAEFAAAERLRRKTDRIDPTRVCRPYCRPGRSALTPNPDEVFRLL